MRFKALILAIVSVSVASSWPAASRDARHNINHACSEAIISKHLKGDIARDEYTKCTGDPKAYGIVF
jgi:hypothetical protein